MPKGSAPKGADLLDASLNAPKGHLEGHPKGRPKGLSKGAKQTKKAGPF